MSVVDAPTARVEPQARPAPTAAHLGRAEGIELLGEVEGSGYRSGAALVRRADGQMVPLGTLLYARLDSRRRCVQDRHPCRSRLRLDVGGLLGGRLGAHVVERLRDVDVLLGGGLRDRTL